MNLQDFEHIPTACRFKNSYSAVSVLKPASSATGYKLTSKHFQFTSLVSHFWRAGKDSLSDKCNFVHHSSPHINVFIKLTKDLFWKRWTV